MFKGTGIRFPEILPTTEFANTFRNCVKYARTRAFFDPYFPVKEIRVRKTSILV